MSRAAPSQPQRRHHRSGSTTRQARTARSGSRRWPVTSRPSSSSRQNVVRSGQAKPPGVASGTFRRWPVGPMAPDAACGSGRGHRAPTVPGTRVALDSGGPYRRPESGSMLGLMDSWEIGYPQICAGACVLGVGLIGCGHGLEHTFGQPARLAGGADRGPGRAGRRGPGPAARHGPGRPGHGPARAGRPHRRPMAQRTGRGGCPRCRWGRTGPAGRLHRRWLRARLRLGAGRPPAVPCGPPGPCSVAP